MWVDSHPVGSCVACWPSRPTPCRTWVSVGTKPQYLDRVRINATGKTGIVVHVYPNGFACVAGATPVQGSVLNNNSTYTWDQFTILPNKDVQ
jgi:hypothetical protein